MAQQIIATAFFLFVGAWVAYLVAKRIEDRVVAWIAIVASAIALAAFAVLYSGERYREIGYGDIVLTILLAIFLRLMTDGFAALLAGGIAGTLISMFRRQTRGQ